MKKHTFAFLALLLLFMQQAQLAHAIDLVNHPDSELCEICLASTSLDQALTDTVSPAPVLAAACLYFTGQGHNYYRQLLTSWQARAPPVYSL